MDCVNRITELTFKGVQLRVAFHPAPEAETIIANWTVRVETGPAGYQMADGSIHSLTEGQPV